VFQETTPQFRQEPEMPARPICFMVMPYSIKPTQQLDNPKAPREVNFDLLWQKALRPAIECINYTPVRADQDLGALIIQEMIERLAISDLVIADVSIPNANVYYEIGIRHACQRVGCVMIAADWAKPLFDIQQMRQVRYPLPTKEVDEEQAAIVREVLCKSIPTLARGDSPFYQALPGFPERLDPSRLSAFKEAFEELSQFQAEVSAARYAPPEQCKQRVSELRQRYKAAIPMPRAVALELLYLVRDCTDWRTTLDFISALPAEMQELVVVREQKALAQAKAGDPFVAIGALEQLIASQGESAERRGLIGGRYKQLYRQETDPARKAQYLDRAIAAYERGMMADLNNYYPSSNLPRLYRLRNRKGDDDRARTSGAITLAACERSRASGVADPWLNATLLGAAFDAGDVGRARELAEQVRSEPGAGWELSAILADAELAIGFHEEERAQELKEILDDLTLLLPAALKAGST
jgi:MAP3K TRAFs-binding domain